MGINNTFGELMRLAQGQPATPVGIVRPLAATESVALTTSHCPIRQCVYNSNSVKMGIK